MGSISSQTKIDLSDAHQAITRYLTHPTLKRAVDGTSTLGA